MTITDNVHFRDGEAAYRNGHRLDSNPYANPRRDSNPHTDRVTPYAKQWGYHSAAWRGGWLYAQAKHRERLQKLGGGNLAEVDLAEVERRVSAQIA